MNESKKNDALTMAVSLNHLIEFYKEVDRSNCNVTPIQKEKVKRALAHLKSIIKSGGMLENLAYNLSENSDKNLASYGKRLLDETACGRRPTVMAIP